MVEARAPEVLRAPIPPLDRVGGAGLACVAAQEVHHGRVHAATRVQVLGLAVPVFAHAQHGVRAILVDQALELGLHDIKRLVPADLDELGLAAVFRVDLLRVATGFPVDAFQRLAHTIFGVHALLVRKCHVVGRRLHLRTQLLAVDVELPHGIGQFLGCVFLVDVQRTNAHDLSVLGVDCRWLTARTAACDALHRRGVAIPLTHAPAPFLEPSWKNRLRDIAGEPVLPIVSCLWFKGTERPIRGQFSSRASYDPVWTDSALVSTDRTQNGRCVTHPQN